MFVFSCFVSGVAYSISMDVFAASLAAGESPPVAAIQAMTSALEASSASTVMGVGSEVQHSALEIGQAALERLGEGPAIPVQAACEMFVRVLTRNAAALGAGEFALVKRELDRRAKAFARRQACSRERVADFGHKFVRDGELVLLHGMSRAVMAVLRTAAAKGVHFQVGCL